MRTALADIDEGQIFFEFAIPRMGKRADVVVLLPSLVVVLEFKVGASSFVGGDIAQVHDYALDLKNFHGGSHSLPIVPILYATRATGSGLGTPVWREDGVADPMLVGAVSWEIWSLRF